MKKIVSTSGASFLFVCAICSSDSKSLTARSPRTMKLAPTDRAKSTVRPSKLATSTRPAAWPSISATASRIVSIRAVSSRSGDLRGLRRTATTTRSKTPAARPITSRWP
jgi:hypothetical protein